jgi:DNA-binding transcriptional MocR family regulator
MTVQILTSENAVTSGSRTLYEQVAGNVAELIDRGTLRPGERVPSVRSYSRQQNVSIATVTQAYRLLEDRGVIEARPQSGYYVRWRRVAAPPEPAKTNPAVSAVEVKVSDLILEVIKASRNPELVRLGSTLAAPEIFPTAELNRITAAIGRREPLAANSFDPPPGNYALRLQAARRSIEAGCALAPDDIITTAGGTEALNLCLRAVAKAGDVIAVESPTFFGILHIINSLGMKVCEIPTFPRDGVCLDELSQRLKCCRIKACVFTLNFSNPLGSCMPDEKKQQLVRLLASHGIPLIEDDIYGNLGFGAVRPRAAKSYDKEGLVMLCDSFTKTLAPGYRVGYVVPGRFKSQVEFLKYVHTSATASLPQMAIAEFLRNGGYDHHLRKMRRFHATEMARLTDAVVRHFPEGTRITRPDGGLSLWIQLPEGTDSMKLYRSALEARISIAPGPLFSAKHQYRNFVRLSCGNPWSERIDGAVRKLGQLIAAQENPSRKGNQRN